MSNTWCILIIVIVNILKNDWFLKWFGCSVSSLCSRSFQLLHQNTMDLQMFMLYLRRMLITLDQEPICTTFFTMQFLCYRYICLLHNATTNTVPTITHGSRLSIIVFCHAISVFIWLHYGVPAKGVIITHLGWQSTPSMFNSLLNYMLTQLKESQWWQFLFLVLVLDLCILLPRNHAYHCCSTSQFLCVNCCIHRIKTRQCMSQYVHLKDTHIILPVYSMYDNTIQFVLAARLFAMLFSAMSHYSEDWLKD